LHCKSAGELQLRDWCHGTEISTLVAAGMGVSLAPACAAKLTIPDVVYRPLRSIGWTSIDAWTKTAATNPAVKLLLTIAREEI